MFTSNSEQRIAQKVIKILGNILTRMAQVSAERENYRIKVEITISFPYVIDVEPPYSRSSQMSVTCKTCNHKNTIDPEDKSFASNKQSS